jgi:3-hydroxyacyl-[acyl-carrier-protein] dehydratase
MKFNMPMDIIAIQQAIPHRYPFLFIDRVIEATKWESIVAIRNITMSDPALQGHFPGNPIVPGVVIVEGAAQAAAVLGCLSKGSLEQCLFTEISEARFRQSVVPGDVLRYELKLTKHRANFVWFEAIMTVDGGEVATVKFSALLK